MMRELIYAFSFPFMLRALIVGTAIAVCSSLLGASLVLKRYSMLGDGLSHVAFGALAISSALGTAPLATAIPIVTVASFLLLWLNRRSRIRGDAATAMVSTTALALGVMVVSLTTGMNTDVRNYLFGSILSMSPEDVKLSLGVAAFVLLLYVFCYHRLFAVTFDEAFARACGLHPEVFNALLAVLTALVVVLGMRMMGVLLISSLIVFPPLTSMRVCKRFRSVVLCSAAVSVACLWAGLVISYVFAAPAGASIVMCHAFCFSAFWCARKLIESNFFSRK